MATTRPSQFPFPPKRYYAGADVPMRVIRRYVRAIAERFQPDKIILFGSYAYGIPHEDSDVDLLVIKPTWSQHSLAVQIRCLRRFPNEPCMAPLRPSSMCALRIRPHSDLA